MKIEKDYLASGDNHPGVSYCQGPLIQYVSSVHLTEVGTPVLDAAAVAREAERLEGEIWPELREFSAPTASYISSARISVNTEDAIRAYLVYMEDSGAAEGYLTVRARKLRYFARHYPGLPLSPEPIRAYLRQFKTADVPTRQDQWKALASLYKFAAGEYGLPNPMLAVVKPRFRKKSGQRLSRDQARQFIAAIDKDLEWALVTCYFGLRFRRIEAERLRVGDIKEDYLIIQGKERTEELPLLPIFRDNLLKLASHHGAGDRLFSAKAETLAYHIGRVFKRAEITDARGSPHTLRNTAGALWSTFGGDWTSNRQLLRHSAKTMTDHYAPLTIDELRVKDERHNPMLNLMRELGLAPAVPEFEPVYKNTTGVFVSTTDPAQLLPELLDQLAALGDKAREISHALGGNGHRAGELAELIKIIKGGDNHIV
ncbi:hypothetical protein ES705_18594 [subsurface metagenome]